MRGPRTTVGFQLGWPFSVASVGPWPVPKGFPRADQPPKGLCESAHKSQQVAHFLLILELVECGTFPCFVIHGSIFNMVGY